MEDPPPRHREEDDLADSGKASKSPMVQSEGRKAVLLALALRIVAGTLWLPQNVCPICIQTHPI